MKTNKIILIMISVFLFSTFFIGCLEEDMVTYEVTFHAMWSQQTHPDDFPDNPHFSGLIGATHNDNVSFWQVGGLSTEGIKNMAETGSKNPLTNEINMARLQQNALELISAGGIATSPGSINVTFRISQNFPYVTLVSMIAPSPDWFVGVDSLSLYENGSFVDEKTIVLYAYDAGTDSGLQYTSPDEPTNPAEPIYFIEDYPFLYDDEIVPIGTFVFEKIE